MQNQNGQQHFTRTPWAFLREGLLWVLYKDNLPKGIVQKRNSIIHPRPRGHSMQHYYIKGNEKSAWALHIRKSKNVAVAPRGGQTYTLQVYQ